jgi:hypothetical protein
LATTYRQLSLPSTLQSLTQSLYQQPSHSISPYSQSHSIYGAQLQPNYGQYQNDVRNSYSQQHYIHQNCAPNMHSPSGLKNQRRHSHGYYSPSYSHGHYSQNQFTSSAPQIYYPPHDQRLNQPHGSLNYSQSSIQNYPHSGSQNYSQSSIQNYSPQSDVQGYSQSDLQHPYQMPQIQLSQYQYHPSAFGQIPPQILIPSPFPRPQISFDPGTNLQLAEKYYRLAISLRPSYWDANINLAALLSSQNRLACALAGKLHLT